MKKVNENNVVETDGSLMQSNSDSKDDEDKDEAEHSESQYESYVNMKPVRDVND